MPPIHVEQQDRQFVIIGGGPAGLTAAYDLTKSGYRPIVLEKRDKVGGISRTESFRGFHFDMGGHRFFTKSEEVNRMWEEVLGPDFLERPRLSRIYYGHKFFNYPLKPFNALLGLGIFKAILVALSYLRWQILPYKQEDTYEEWVTNRFGKRLFETFFKAYTEKVWGIPTSELRAEWAAQRIKDLDLKTAIVSMFIKPRATIKTLIEEFRYPRQGPGMMWNAVKEKVEEAQGLVCLNTDVVAIKRQEDCIESVITRSADGHEEEIRGTDFISSMPLSEFIQKLDPPAPAPVQRAAAKLHYRDFLTVCLVVNQPNLFPDNWIYVHDPAVKVGRIQNFKNWSPEMVPDPSKSSLGMEYFCNEGDELWSMPDQELVEMARREIETVGLARAADVEDGAVFRVEKSYPVYDSEYRGVLDVIRGYTDRLPNFQTVGRNGLHRYNNQDHAMLTGMLAVRNLVYGEKNDLWVVNGEQEYHEEVRTPESKVHDVTEVLQEALIRVFEKLDPVAFGLSTGIAAAVLISLATLILTLRGGDIIGPNLGLLREFLPGYDVSVGGSILGLIYGFIIGLASGWGFATLRNMILFVYVAISERRVQLSLLRQVLDF